LLARQLICVWATKYNVALYLVLIRNRSTALHRFDRVTVDEIAAAADVGRMTVFNHFPRKEDSVGLQ